MQTPRSTSKSCLRMASRCERMKNRDSQLPPQNSSIVPSKTSAGLALSYETFRIQSKHRRLRYISKACSYCTTAPVRLILTETCLSLAPYGKLPMTLTLRYSPRPYAPLFRALVVSASTYLSRGSSKGVLYRRTLYRARSSAHSRAKRLAVAIIFCTSSHDNIKVLCGYLL